MSEMSFTIYPVRNEHKMVEKLMFASEAKV